MINAASFDADCKPSGASQVRETLLLPTESLAKFVMGLLAKSILKPVGEVSGSVWPTIWPSGIVTRKVEVFKMDELCS